MPATSGRIIRASPSRIDAARIEPKVFVNPEISDPGSLAEIARDLRALLAESKQVQQGLGAERANGRRLAQSLTPFLKQHSQLVEQHARVLQLIDERAGEAAATLRAVSEYAARIEAAESRCEQRLAETQKLISQMDTRHGGARGAANDHSGETLTDTQREIEVIENRASQALTRLRREFDAHLIHAADEANGRIDASEVRMNALELAASESVVKLRESLDGVIEEAGTRALELESRLEEMRGNARSALDDAQTRIDNTLKLGRLKLEELCSAFSAWIEAGEANAPTQRVTAARDEAIRAIQRTRQEASETLEDAQRALSEVVRTVRAELTAFDQTIESRMGRTRGETQESPLDEPGDGDDSISQGEGAD